MASISTTFLEAGKFAVDVMASSEVGEAWSLPSALIGYSVGGIAGHICSLICLTESLLEEVEPSGLYVIGIELFYSGNKVDYPDDLNFGLHSFLREDGERRAKAGQSSLIETSMNSLRRLEKILSTSYPKRLVPVVKIRNSATTLDTYLRTRIVELIVHADDLLASMSDPPEMIAPQEAMNVTLNTLMLLSRSMSSNLNVVRAFARQERADLQEIRVF